MLYPHCFSIVIADEGSRAKMPYNCFSNAMLVAQESTLLICMFMYACLIHLRMYVCMYINNGTGFGGVVVS